MNLNITSISILPPSNRLFQPLQPVELNHCVSCQGETDVHFRCPHCENLVHGVAPCSKARTDTDGGTDILCTHCFDLAEIRQQRSGAKRKLEAQAEQMLHMSRQRYEPAVIGQNVVIRIPEVDRGRADLQNLMAVVIDHTDGFYKLGTKDGSLARSYVRNEFEICKEKFFTIEDVTDKQISLREAVAAASITGRPQGVFKCNCKGGCKGRCKCKAANLLCNSRCHSSSSCCNK